MSHTKRNTGVTFALDARQPQKPTSPLRDTNLQLLERVLTETSHLLNQNCRLVGNLDNQSRQIFGFLQTLHPTPGQQTARVNSGAVSTVRPGGLTDGGGLTDIFETSGGSIFASYPSGERAREPIISFIEDGPEPSSVGGSLDDYVPSDSIFRDEHEYGEATLKFQSIARKRSPLNDNPPSFPPSYVEGNPKDTARSPSPSKSRSGSSLESTDSAHPSHSRVASAAKNRGLGSPAAGAKVEPAETKPVREPAPESEHPWRVTWKTSGLHPESMAKAWWDFAMSLIYWIDLVVLPVYLSFEKSNPGQRPQAGWLVLPIFSIMDTLISCITLRPRRGSNELCGLGESLLLYIISVTFLVDVVTMVPWNWILKSESAELLGFIRLLRVSFHLFPIVNRNRIYEALGDRLQEYGIGGSNGRMISCFLWVLYYLHINTCSTFFIGRLSKYIKASWDSVYFIVDHPVWNQYTWGFLMAVANSWPFTIPITPQRAEELWLHSIFMIVGALMTGTLSGFIQSSRLDLDPAGRLYKEKLDQANEYMAIKKIDESTRSRVREYYRLKFREKIFDEGAIMREMNQELRNQFAGGTGRALLQSVPFLNHPDQAIQSALAMSMREHFYVSGHTLYQQGTRGHNMYFLQTGSVLARDEDGVAIRTYTSGDFFGENALLTDCIRGHTAQVLTACHVYELDRSQYESVCERFPDLVNLAYGG
ncbi:uncharacterized protein EV422DRAFT_133392 [Fimicolochytrium jonesii]|uniref:uncharacterized protein n=1 Tax=Fimicolochytrium jonesii TaxID=1396493 RepID=UPI0022FE4D26|nr:uncharacterized protein EV422DRAFT_133392 [Fimicolochytrium jonesii]KAI8825611.1 hypothetical protein EV422DRAFT_133392 [Fimicolochytrium jonesii]